MKKVFVIAGFLLCLIGFKNYATEPDTLARRLEYQTWIYPQEKVYVATDRNIYLAGDTIRFRAFLVDAVSLLQKDNGSKYVYIEVVDPFGKEINRVKVKQNDGIYAGIVPLPAELAEGTYTLGAYTLFMKNQGADFIFKKPLPIKSQLSGSFKLDAYMDGNILTTSLTDKNGKSARAEDILIFSKDGVVKDGISKRSSYNMALNKKLLNEELLKVRYDNYDKFVRIYKDSTAQSITFHPEGGYMIPNVNNRIAFKALGRDGLSIDVKGVVENSKGKKICDFESSHNGMGTFNLNPEEGENYYAKVNGKMYNLPSSNSNASVLAVNSERDSLRVRLNGVFKPELTLLANNCGVVTYSKHIDSKEISIPKNKIGSGLVQLYLLDSNDNILSSRLIFNRNGYIYVDSTSELPAGDYAITSRKTGTDSIVYSSIISELMLQSDLQGYIEKPDYYFSNPDATKDLHLDNLLLTQGWKRYDTQSALKGKFKEPKAPMEIGSEISGTVYSRWKSKPLDDATINVIAPQIRYVGVTKTDADGNFTINDVDWPEGTLFAIQAFNKNGNQEHNLIINSDETIPVEQLAEDYTTSIPDFYYGSNLGVWLKDLNVDAPKTDDELRMDLYEVLGISSFTDFGNNHNTLTSYEDVINRIPGLRIYNGNVVNISGRWFGSNRANAGLVEIWLDGVRWSPYEMGDTPSAMSNTFSDLCAKYPIEKIKSIRYFRSYTAALISADAANNAGALMIATKDGTKYTDWNEDLFIKRVTPIGYQKASEAYQPHFIYDPINETPTPVSYWYPQIHSLEDFTPLENSNIIIEGITESGIPYRGAIRSKK